MSGIESYWTKSVKLPPCSELKARGPEIATYLGYTSYGVAKYSMAAQGMSLEAKASGGGVPSMRSGGVTAALQSVGACGYIKPAAEKSLHDALVRGGIKRCIGYQS